MAIKYANNLERAGRLFDALKANLEFASSIDNTTPLADIAMQNAQRILMRLSDNERAEAQVLLKTVESPQTTKAMQIRDLPEKELTSQTTLPMVSVVVPCYNCQDYLPATIESLRIQTYPYPYFEAILIDDFSTDASAAIAKDISKRDQRFRFYQHRANGGLSSARNSGIRLARGDYICFLDSDDLLAATSIERRAHALYKFHHDEVVAGVYDHSVSISDDFKGMIEAKEIKKTKEYVDFISAQGECPFNANQPMLKRFLLIDLGGFPENYPQAEDWRLWSKALRAGYIFIPIHSVGSGYRQTANSMVRRSPLLHVKKSFGNFFRAHQPYDAENDPGEVNYESNFCAAPVFLQQVGLYEARRKFLVRVLNFLGIEFARSTDCGRELSIEEVANEITSIEPEFSLVFTGYTIENTIGWFGNGFKRYRGVETITDKDRDIISRFVNELLVRLGVSNNCVLIGDNRRIIPRRCFLRNPFSPVDVVFFPHKEYHTRSFELLLPHLSSHELTYAFVDISVPYRDENARLPSAGKFMLSYNEFVFSRLLPRSIVCMNDWDTVVKPVVREANEHGIPTIGIVEGVQDYLDVDTGRKRNPYREVANVFLPGSFDRRYFAGTSQRLFDMGVQRLEGLEKYRQARRLAPRHSPPIAALNVNFSYGVLVDRRHRWVSDVAEACRRTGYRLVISQHPQDKGDLSAYDVDERPLYDLLVEADFFISRFSGAILEALTMECPVIYYNGHGEKIDKFANSYDAYDIATNIDELANILERGPQADRDASRFLKYHGGLGEPGATSVVERTANAIEQIVRETPISLRQMARFKRKLVS